MALAGSQKKFKLKVHQSNFSEISLVINGKDFPGVQEDDIVKISSCDGDPANYLVMKVKSLKGELQKETISIEAGIANKFGLHAFQSVYVNKVDPVDISLDMLEVTFKDQYISRSDMWRLKKHMVGSCTCLDEKIEFSDIRAQVSELWIDSEKVKCGLITDYTRIVLRSASALVYIFVQMSTEMWDFDAFGQLNFERAVNGFLKELFFKWKEKCYHEITLVLFSRTFYDAVTADDFPDEVRGVVQRDYRGRYYVDFYNCVAHHERSDDCSALLFVMQKLFSAYKDLIKIAGCPPGENSTAAEGNFLEAINMPLNVFEKHYVDRNFDRTGQLVMCITPGVGVFDVDRDLTVLTKERMIDNGIGSDLICLGQRPLHAVPLFKFHQKCDKEFEMYDKSKGNHHDFNIPHWINHSFYSSNPFPDIGTTGIRYVPRIHLARLKSAGDGVSLTSACRSPQGGPSKNPYRTELPSFLEVEYEEFDREIFCLPRAKRLGSSSFLAKRNAPKRSTSIEVRKAAERMRTISDEWKQCGSPDEFTKLKQTNPLYIPNRHVAELSRIRGVAREASSVGVAANLERYLERRDESSSALVVGSAHSLQTPTKQKRSARRALINPFVASYTLAPLSSNRRRWVHTLPRTEAYKKIGRHSRASESSSIDFCEEDESVDLNSNSSSAGNEIATRTTVPGADPAPSVVGSCNSNESSVYDLYDPRPMLGIMELRRHGSQAFPHLPSVDWKALRSPACLPITNDYYPSNARLQSEYTEQPYTLIPDDDSAFSSGSNADSLLTVDGEHEPGYQMQAAQQVSAREIFLELVNQRLCQGFQLVVPSRRGHRRHYDSTNSFTGRISSSPGGADVSFMSTGSASPGYSSMSETYTLNHGRQYHVVTLTPTNEILVKVYKPRHPLRTSTIEYKYLLWAISRDKYRMAKVKFSHEQYESYYWNYQDNYVCCGGVGSDFMLTSNIKYWRSKFIIIPSPAAKLKAQKLETETAAKEGREVRYDIFEEQTPNQNDAAHQTWDGLVRFLDHVNKIRRHATSGTLRKPWAGKPPVTTAAGSLPTGLGALGATPVISRVHTSQTPPGSTSTPASGRSTPVLTKNQTSPPDISGKSTRTEQHPVQTSSPLQGVETSPSTASAVDEKGDSNRARLNALSEAKDIVEAMQDENFGFVFLPRSKGIPSHTFLSVEAAQWCVVNMDGVDNVKDACKLLQRLCDGRFLCHASGDLTHPFIYGYYMYFLTDEKMQENDLADPSSHQYEVNTEARQYFQDQWLEVGIKIPEEKVTPTGTHTPRPRHKSALSSLLEKESIMRKEAAENDMKTVLISMNKNRHKTGRSEWCQLQYPRAVTPWRGMIILSFNMQWMVATATCLFEMLQTWSREANRCHLCMLPAPNNPFAFPHTERDASPLHCPLFITVNFAALLEADADFQALYKNGMECRKRIIHFMEKVSAKFGFMRHANNQDPEAERNNTSNSQQFVHYTGRVFLEIPVTDDYQVQGRSLATKQKRVGCPSPRKESPRLPSRLISPVNKTKSGFNVEEDNDTPTTTPVENSQLEKVLTIDLKSAGFYFSSNHLFTKRWRSVAPGVFDDCPTRNLEADFIKFCSNSDSRLIHYYKSCYGSN